MRKPKPSGKSIGKHERSNKSYNRKSGKRLPGRCILIVCEGAETEPNYFQELKEYLKLSLLVEVKIEGKAGPPISLLEKAESLVMQRKKDIQVKRIDNIPFEDVWCVFDVENPNNNPTFNPAIQKADENKFSLAISNPAFEFWYILHFKSTTRPFSNGEEIKDYLRQKFINDYQETKSVFNQLAPFTSLAIQRSKSILEKQTQNHQRFPNPSTQVHLLVEKMITMSPSGYFHFFKKEV